MSKKRIIVLILDPSIFIPVCYKLWNQGIVIHCEIKHQVLVCLWSCRKIIRPTVKKSAWNVGNVSDFNLYCKYWHFKKFSIFSVAMQKMVDLQCISELFSLNFIVLQNIIYYRNNYRSLKTRTKMTTSNTDAPYNGSIFIFRKKAVANSFVT